MLKNLDFNNFISAMKLPQDTNNPEQYTELLAQYSMPFQKKLSSKYICSSESTQVYDNEKLYYHKNNGCFTGLSALLASELHISNSAECTSTLSVPSQELYHNGTMLSII